MISKKLGRSVVSGLVLLGLGEGEGSASLLPMLGAPRPHTEAGWREGSTRRGQVPRLPSPELGRDSGTGTWTLGSAPVLGSCPAPDASEDTSTSWCEQEAHAWHRHDHNHQINCLLIFFFLKYYMFKETPKLKRLDNFWYICSKGMRILLVNFQDG